MQPYEKSLAFSVMMVNALWPEPWTVCHWMSEWQVGCNVKDRRNGVICTCCFAARIIWRVENQKATCIWISPITKTRNSNCLLILGFKIPLWMRDSHWGSHLGACVFFDVSERIAISILAIRKSTYLCCSVKPCFLRAEVVLEIVHKVDPFGVFEGIFLPKSWNDCHMYTCRL